MDKVAEMVSDIAKLDHQPSQKGKVLQMLLVPVDQQK
jgi:translation initiation factor IF-3